MKWKNSVVGFLTVMFVAVVGLAIERALGLGAAGVSLALLPAAWGQYNTRDANKLEIVPWVWWDTVTYTSGTTQSLNFFNAVRATRDLGNMTLASAFANPYAFLVRVCRFFIKNQVLSLDQSASAAAQTGALNDVQLLIRTGVFTFVIGQKTAFEAPLWMITAGGGASGPLADAGATAANRTVSYGQSGVADPRSVTTLWMPLVVDSVINFTVNLGWPAGAVTLAGGNSDLCIALDGELSRPTQ